MKSGIYIITCLVSGKYYIGRAINWKDRLYGHKTKLKSNSHDNIHLQNAYNLYGMENFIFELLEEYPKEFLCSMENWWCNMLLAHNPEFGYNIAPTNPFGKLSNSEQTRKRISESKKGVSFSEQHKKNLSAGQKGKIVSEETKEKLRKIHTGKTNSPEARAKLSLKHKGKILSEEHKNKLKKAWIKRKEIPVTQETKDKISKSLKGNKQTQKVKDAVRLAQSIPIIQLTLDGEFIKTWESATKASKELNIDRNNIYKIATNKIKKPRKYKWRYLTIEELDNNKIKENGNN